jgi:hypothetical protein
MMSDTVHHQCSVYISNAAMHANTYTQQVCTDTLERLSVRYCVSLCGCLLWRPLLLAYGP